MTNRSRASFRLRWLGCLLWLAVADAAAWNAAGHRLSATIAWQQLSPATQHEVSALLARHPAAADWEKQLRRGKADRDPTPQALFAEAASWPDELRRAARQAAPGTAPGVAQGDWHYLNWPVDRGAKASRGGRLDREILRQAKRLGERRRPAAERAEALAWLIHLVGDAHQPLHVASWPQAGGGFDDGGLEFKVHDAQRPWLRESSLHAWWDDLPGPPWLRGERLERRVAELLRRHPVTAVGGRAVNDWLVESFSAARDWVRPAGTVSPWEVDAEYRTRALDYCDQRLVAAGVRLARLLEATLGR